MRTLMACALFGGGLAGLFVWLMYEIVCILDRVV